MQSKSRPGWSAQPISARMKLGRIGLPVGGIAAVVAVVMLAAPVAGGASTTITFTAPYAQLAKIYSSTVTAYGCHTIANDPVTPAINTKTGVITSWQHSVAGNCNSGFVYAYTFATLGFTGPKWTASSTGNTTVTVQWSIDWSARATADIETNGVNSTAWASAFLEAYSWVTDTTTGTSYIGNGTSFLTLTDLWTTNGTMFAHSAGAQTYWMSISLWAQKGDWYTLGTELFSQTYDYSSMCDQTAWSTMDLGSGSHSATLVSVVVS
jgi:hypothetical protein